MKKVISRYVFFITLIIITYFLYIFPFEILSKYIFKEETSLIISIINTFFFYLFIIYYLKSYTTFKPLKVFVYEGLGIGFISFIVIIVSIIINYFGYFEETSIGITSLISIIIITLYGIFKAKSISIRNITIDTTKIDKDYNIIFLSDVHLGTNSTKHLQKILNSIETLKYDFILIGGDLIDSSSFKLENLKLFNLIKKEIYFVNGNHEYYLKDYKKKIKDLTKYNIKVLKNTNQKIGQINLIGIDDLELPINKISYVNNLKKDKLFNIVISHKPDIWNSLKDKVDLMLSGHTHNGQIFPFKFIVMLKFKYIYGLYKSDFSNFYVSSGAGCWGPRLRIGSSNEIVSFRLKKVN
jgi:predicted MPP superfamily phosphohydrolase